jgi:hypothetical protein
MKSLEKLLSISSGPLGSETAPVNLPDLDAFAELGGQLKALLRCRNGFYAFESALHFFPATPPGTEIGLNSWNSNELWRCEYGDLAEGALFFSEDAFGNQFALQGKHVCFFDAETGEFTEFSDGLEAWADRVLKAYKVSTGYRLLHEWQQKNGALAVGSRLMPRIPFVLGGSYSLDNLYALSSVSGMKTRGNLARQLKDLPDGAQVRFQVIE